MKRPRTDTRASATTDDDPELEKLRKQAKSRKRAKRSDQAISVIQRAHDPYDDAQFWSHIIAQLVDTSIVSFDQVRKAADQVAAFDDDAHAAQARRHGLDDDY